MEEPPHESAEAAQTGDAPHWHDEAHSPPFLDTGTLTRLAIMASGWMFLGMALWIVWLDPRPGAPLPVTPDWGVRDAALVLVAAWSLRGMALGVWQVCLPQLRYRFGFEPQRLAANAVGLALQMLAFAIAVNAFAAHVHQAGLAELGFRHCSPGWLLAGAAVGVALGPGLLVLGWIGARISGETLELEGQQLEYLAPRGEPRGQRWPATTGMLLLTVIVTPVVEEALFRGVVCQALTREWPQWVAVLASALIFGWFHRASGTLVVALTAFTGLLFGSLFLASDSLWPAVVAHMLINSKILAAFLPGFLPQPAGRAASGATAAVEEDDAASSSTADTRDGASSDPVQTANSSPE